MRNYRLDFLMPVNGGEIKTTSHDFRRRNSIQDHALKAQRDSIHTVLSHFKGGFLLGAGDEYKGCIRPQKGAGRRTVIPDDPITTCNQILVWFCFYEWHIFLLE